jgi:phenylalanyl-tRNA synthetase alpha chain
MLNNPTTTTPTRQYSGAINNDSSGSKQERLAQETAYSNLTASIRDKIGRNLHLKRNHPIGILNHMIVDFFENDYRTLTKVRPSASDCRIFTVVDSLSPVSSVHDTFDSLLFPADHPGRRKVCRQPIDQALVGTASEL